MKFSHFLSILIVATLIPAALAQTQESKLVVSPGRQFEERTALLKEIEDSKQQNLIQPLRNAFKSLDDAVRAGTADDVYLFREINRLRGILHQGNTETGTDFSTYLARIIGKISDKVPKQAKSSNLKTWFLLQEDGSVSRLTSLSPVTAPSDAAIQSAIQNAIKSAAPFTGYPEAQSAPVQLTFWFSNGKPQISIEQGSTDSVAPTVQRLAMKKILDRCDSLIYRKKANEALPELNEFLKTNPNSAEGYYSRATAYVALKDYPHAIADYSKAIKLNPKDKFNYLELADLHQKMKRKDLAIQVLTQGTASATDPDEDCLGERAKLLASQEKYEEALADANKRLKHREEQVARLQKTNSSAVAVKQARKKLGSAYFVRAFILDKAHRYEEGIKDWGNVIDCVEENAGCAFNNRGLAHKALGHWEEALSDMNAACIRAPFHCDHFVNRAHLNQSFSKTETLNFDYKEGLRLAIEQITKDSLTDSVSARDLISRGAAYVGLLQFENAIADSRKALTLDSDNEEAYIVIGDASFGLEKYPEAIEAYSKALALAPREPLPLVRRAKVHLKMGFKDKADADSLGAAKLGFIEPPKVEAVDTTSGAN